MGGERLGARLHGGHDPSPGPVHGARIARVRWFGPDPIQAASGSIRHAARRRESAENLAGKSPEVAHESMSQSVIGKADRFRKSDRERCGLHPQLSLR